MSTIEAILAGSEQVKSRASKSDHTYLMEVYCYYILYILYIFTQKISIRVQQCVHSFAMLARSQLKAIAYGLLKQTYIDPPLTSCVHCTLCRNCSLSTYY